MILFGAVYCILLQQAFSQCLPPASLFSLSPPPPLNLVVPACPSCLDLSDISAVLSSSISSSLSSALPLLLDATLPTVVTSTLEAAAPLLCKPPSAPYTPPAACTCTSLAPPCSPPAPTCVSCSPPACQTAAASYVLYSPPPTCATPTYCAC